MGKAQMYCASAVETLPLIHCRSTEGRSFTRKNCRLNYVVNVWRSGFTLTFNICIMNCVRFVCGIKVLFIYYVIEDGGVGVFPIYYNILIRDQPKNPKNFTKKSKRFHREKKSPRNPKRNH